jgi:hypothetical protein
MRVRDKEIKKGDAGVSFVTRRHGRGKIILAAQQNCAVLKKARLRKRLDHKFLK